MRYAKPPLSLDDQAALMVQCGMRGDVALMKERLASVSYYRLSGYWYPFRNTDDTFKPGTTFDKVWERYVLDRRLRILLMDALERIEIAVRTQLSYHHAHGFGAFGYASSPASLPKLTAPDRQKLVDRVRDEVSRSKEKFVGHFRLKYGDTHTDLPIWMATEVMTFGSVLTLFRGCPRQVKKAVASHFGVPDEVMDSWLLALNAVRNICAHHGRLWNRELGVKPFIPRVDRYPQWHSPVRVENNRIFGILTICKHCLDRVAPQSAWRARVRELLNQHPAIPLRNMGFPDNWADCAVWK